MSTEAILTPGEVIGILWFFIAFNAVFLSIRLFLIITRPRVTVAAFASEACVFLAFFLFLLETISTTSYQAMLIKYRDDPLVEKSMGMPESTLILMFKVRWILLPTTLTNH